MTDEQLEQLIALAEATAPDDAAAALVLADQLSALGDPRGELIVLDALDRAGRLDRPDQLERLLLLACEYTFPRRGPEPLPLRWERVTDDSRSYRVIDDEVVVAFHFHGPNLDFELEHGSGLLLHPATDVDSCGLWVPEEQGLALSGSLPGLCDDEDWTEATAAECIPVLADWVRNRIPACVLLLPFETYDYLPAPRYDGGPPRIAHLPAGFRRPRDIPRDRYGLAGRDYHRWISTYRRLEAMLSR